MKPFCSSHPKQGHKFVSCGHERVRARTFCLLPAVSPIVYLSLHRQQRADALAESIASHRGDCTRFAV